MARRCEKLRTDDAHALCHLYTVKHKNTGETEANTEAKKPSENVRGNATAHSGAAIGPHGLQIGIVTDRH